MIRVLRFLKAFPTRRSWLSLGQAGPLFFLCVATFSGRLACEEPSHGSANLSCQDILRVLREKKGEELFRFITHIDSKGFDKSLYTNEEIDQILEELNRIIRTDTYYIVSRGKSGEEFKVFLNRGEGVRSAIHRWKFQKNANELRLLPMKERVDEIIAHMMIPPGKGEYSKTDNYIRELVLTGREGVPFIIRHKPEDPSTPLSIVVALGKIADPKSVDYIIKVLRTEDPRWKGAKVYSAEALAGSRGDKVIKALIDALSDDSYVDIDKHQPQAPYKGHKPWLARYYLLRHAASQSLSAITGLDWGLLFNEDPRTWSAWYETSDKNNFSPAKVKRGGEDISVLVEHLFHRYMSGRPNPWQSQNPLAKQENIRSLARDLSSLGIAVNLHLQSWCEALVKERPLWGKELNDWCRKLMAEIGELEKKDH